jgi:hypothetical protein
MEKFWQKIDWPKHAMANLESRLMLSPREAEILTRRRAGEKYVAIAKSLQITPPYVRQIHLLAESKDVESRRTVRCPHCRSDVPVYGRTARA